MCLFTVKFTSEFQKTLQADNGRERKDLHVNFCDLSQFWTDVSFISLHQLVASFIYTLTSFLDFVTHPFLHSLVTRFKASN